MQVYDYNYHSKSSILELLNDELSVIARVSIPKEEWNANAKGKTYSEIIIWLNNKYGN